MANIQFQLRRGTSGEWTSADTILASGEMGIETDTHKFKIGDGTTAWTSLSYGLGFDQSLNTDDNVIFNQVTASNTISVQGITLSNVSGRLHGTRLGTTGVSSDVQLLMLGDDTSDGSSYDRILTFNGTPSTSKTIYKYHNSSLYFPTDSDYLTSDSSDWNFGSDSFCVDSWVYVPDTISDWKVIFSNSHIFVQLSHPGARPSYSSRLVIDSTEYTFSSDFSYNTWFHLAVTGNGTTMKVYLNGSEVVSTSYSGIGNGTSSDTLYLGGSAGYKFGSCYLDNFRITSGSTVFSGTFTPPGENDYGFTYAQVNSSVIGYTGSAGYIGTDGYTGSMGDQGYTGSAGTSGTNGYTGSAGTSGTNGYTGSAGTSGTNGYTGSAGTSGTNGYTGSVGGSLLPQLSTSTSYTTVSADSGKHIYWASTSTGTITISSNTSVAYDLGTAIAMVVPVGNGTINIGVDTDTLVMAGAGSTGTRVLVAPGMATALKIGTTTWMISGAGLA